MNTGCWASACCRRWTLAIFDSYFHGLRIFLSLFLALFAAPAFSDSPTILLLQSGNAPVYQEVTSNILSSLESICPECQAYQIEQASIEDIQIDDLLKSGASRLDLVVSIGVKAAKQIADSGLSIPKLYTLIPKSSAVALKLEKRSNTVSAIYLDQPLARQLNLIKLIGTAKLVLGVLFGPSTTAFRPKLEMIANSLNIATRTETVKSGAEVGPALRRLLDSSDILLALPDPIVYNQNTIFNIFLSSYHNQIPIVGFSASYVKAGAMLAVYSTPSDIGKHIAETIQQFVIADNNHLANREFPRYFSIEVNNSVARSLDINLPAPTELKQQLERLEGQ